MSSLRFKVLTWKGYPNQYTWEGWKQLRNLEQFREFISEHPKKAYRKLLKHLLKKTEQNREEPTGVVDNGNKSDTVGKIDTNSAFVEVSKIEGGEIESQPTEKIRFKGTKRRKEATTLSEDSPRRGKRERKRSWKFGKRIPSTS